MAQASGGLAVGAGTVRYAGGTSAGLGTLSPSLQWVSPGASIGVSVLAALLPHSAWALVGSTDARVTSHPFAGRWRVGSELSSTATSVTGGDRTGAVDLLAEVSRREASWGIAAAAGPSAGWIRGTAGAAGPHLRLRGWWEALDLHLTGSLESTRLLGSWYSDFTTGATVHHGPLDLTLTAAGRASPGWGSAAAGSAVLELAISPRLGLEVAGGSVLGDPLQGFPRTGFVSAVVHLFFPGRFLAPGRAMSRALTHPDASGRVEVTFHVMADSVSIAGDWNGWVPEPLTPVSPGVWKLTTRLAPGVYRFGLIIAPGRRWIAPAGYATVPDDWGGRAAVLVVQ